MSYVLAIGMAWLGLNCAIIGLRSWRYERGISVLAYSGAFLCCTVALIALSIGTATKARAAFDATMRSPAEQQAYQRMAALHPAPQPFGVKAKPKHNHPHRSLESRRKIGEARGMVTITVASGARITVAPSFAPKIAAFIADLCGERGYCPKRIHCFDFTGHVHNSRHYAGQACDFEQGGWNKTAKPMYRLKGLAARHGLRDGCSFRDCGHIDDGHNKRKR